MVFTATGSGDLAAQGQRFFAATESDNLAAQGWRSEQGEVRLTEGRCEMARIYREDDVGDGAVRNCLWGGAERQK